MKLTNDIVSKLMLGDVIEQRGEDRKQGCGGVVDVLGHSFNLQQQTQQVQNVSLCQDAAVPQQKQSLTWFLLDTLPSFRFSTIFSMSSAALSKNCRRMAFTISGPDFMTVLQNNRQLQNPVCPLSLGGRRGDGR